MSAEVRPGYKRTEIGVVPEDWSIKSLADLCSFENGDRGKNYPSPGSFVSSGIPFINAGHLSNGNIDLHQMDYITPERFNKLGGGKVRDGDILFCLRGSLGKFGLITSAITCGAIASSLVIVRPKTSSTTKEYLSSYFSSELCANMIETWAGGAAQPNLGAQDLAKFLVAIPQCKGEQEKISSALADMSALISSLDQLIAKRRDIQQATMQQLLTGQRRLPGFSGGWGVTRLGDLVSRMANGCVYTPDEKNGVPITRIETISDGTINWNRIGHAKPSPEIESYKIQRGDILYSHINSIDHIGKVARYSDCKPLYHGMNLILLRPNSNIDSDFLFFLLSSETIRRTARTLAKKAVSQASINTKELRALELTIPDMGEQIAVASTLSDMDAELAALESRRDKARQLKQGMMQELLSGRIRLA